MTELIWDGKYDAQGRTVAPPRIALPFQTVEAVNESAADRDRMQDLFASGRPTDWRNRVIWGDKKYVLPSLLEEFAGRSISSRSVRRSPGASTAIRARRRLMTQTPRGYS